jgi:flagellin
MFSELVTLRAAKLNRLALNQSLNRLATGSRINRAADNPAGLIASMTMDATLAALDAESTANQRAMNMSDTADAALGQVSDLLGEAKALVSANANSAGLSAEERHANQLEIDSILASVDRIARTTSFNGQKLLDGTATIGASGQELSVGSTMSKNLGQVTIDSAEYDLSGIGGGKSLDTTASANVEKASKVVDAAINQVATMRGRIGAFSKDSLAPRLTEVAASREHLLAMVSMIRDVDYAMEASAKLRAELLERGSMVLLTKSRRQSRGAMLSLLA